MMKWKRPGKILLFLALFSIVVIFPAYPASAEIPVYIVLDFDDPSAGQFRAFLEREISGLEGITLVGKDHLALEDCAVVSVVGFRFRGRSGEELGFPFSYAFGYSEPGEEGFWFLYHNVLAGYPTDEGLSWAAGEIAEELDFELDLWW